MDDARKRGRRPGTRSRHGGPGLPERIFPEMATLLGRAGLAAALALTGGTPQATAQTPADLRQRVATIGLPLFYGERPLREVVVRIAGFDPDPGVNREGLKAVLAPLLRADTLARIDTLPDTEGFVGAAALREAGIDIAYDPALLRLVYTPTADASQRRILSLRRGGPQANSLEPNAVPAALSGFLNLRNSVSYDYDDDDLRYRLGLDGAVRAFGIVVEGVGTLDDEDGFRRFETRAVYDMPQRSARASVGDVYVEPVGFQTGSFIGGARLHSTLADEQINRTLRSRGGTFFRLERRSTVEAFVNEQLRRRFTLDAGEYDIRDLTLTEGQNTVRLRIEDPDGRVEEEVFTVYFDRTLLAPGEHEYAAAFGVESDLSDGDRDYDTDRLTGSAHYRRGITDYLTLGANGQFDEEGEMIGAAALAATPFGAVGLDVAASRHETEDTGFAADLDIAFEDVLFLGPERTLPGSLAFSLSYLTEDFYRIGSGTDPRNLTRVQLDANYYQRLTDRTDLGLSGGYADLYDGKDRYFAQVGAYHRLTPDMSLRAAVGYGSDDDSVYGTIGLSYRFLPPARVTTSYDTRDNATEVGLFYHDGEHVGSITGSAYLRRDDRRSTFDGEVDYIGNRFDASLSHASFGDDIDELGRRNLTTARLDTALAFADGRFGISRPINNGFALLERHESLAGSELIVRDVVDAEPLASDGFGPAVLPLGGNYTIRRIAYDIEPRPVGYADEEGEFRVRPGYRTGYLLTVGSDYSMTAIGTIRDADGEPVVNLVGRMTELGRDDPRSIDVFTNGVGRFAGQGLRPGRWELVLPTAPETRIVVDIPDTEDSFVRLGDVTPLPSVSGRTR